jgi:hypothetical protein
MVWVSSDSGGLLENLALSVNLRVAGVVVALTRPSTASRFRDFYVLPSPIRLSFATKLRGE